jgi:RND family efflux transporter MFP subunit
MSLRKWHSAAILTGRYCRGSDMRRKPFVAIGLLSAGLAACEQPPPPAPQIRSVRAVKVEHRVISESVVLIGQIKARDEIGLAFRIDGRLIERSANPGDQIRVGHVVARLDSQTEQNALQAAEADVAAAQAALAQAEKLESRQADLIKRGVTSRALYDQALQQLQTAQAQLDSAQARHRSAQNRITYTELKSDVNGIVTAKGAEPGEFVRAGQMIVRVAREVYKDAVFEVPAQLALSRRVPQDPVVQVALVDHPGIKTTGRIREVTPQADPVTRLFQVKVGLDDPPPEFFLGITVSGGISFDSPAVMTIPLAAIIESDGKPSVWVVDPTTSTVALRTVEILRYDPSAVIISSGLRDGEVVVTAGVNALHPGQKVKLLAGST